MKKRIILATLCLASMEIASYVAFNWLLPQPLRLNALATAYPDDIASRDNQPNIDTGRQPKIIPYIWSNYRPNPKSPQANSHGWRYGGGPRPKGRFRILCLGGSTTWSDLATEPSKSYPAQLESYLREDGHDVDVVNGGCSYYTSAELVGTMAFRGIYEQPDLVIIHTGGNDTAPLRSPRHYLNDYTHWRTIDRSAPLSRTDIFKSYWMIPSWTSRLALAAILRPNPLYGGMAARQIDSAQAGHLATNDISTREPVGLENNLITLVAMSRSHGAKVVAMTFNMRHENLDHLVPALRSDPALREQVTRRSMLSTQKSNQSISKICSQMDVPLVPFHEFEPSNPEDWGDQCHLHDTGLRDKAVYVGNWLLKLGLIP